MFNVFSTFLFISFRWNLCSQNQTIHSLVNIAHLLPCPLSTTSILLQGRSNNQLKSRIRSSIYLIDGYGSSESDECEEANCQDSISFVSGYSRPRNFAYQCQFGLNPASWNSAAWTWIQRQIYLLRGTRRASMEVRRRHRCLRPIQEEFLSPSHLANANP